MSAVATAAPAPGDVYAVIVGYNGGRPGLPGLHFADDDAIRFSLFMRGLDSPTRRVHVWTLTEIDAETADMLDGAGLKVPVHGPPTRSALAAVMADVGRALTGAHPGAPPPSFYFIYAGHGLPGQVLLQPEPGSSQSGITGHEISVAVSALTRSTPDLRAFVFLDACFENCQCTSYSSGAPASASPVARWICRGCTYASENPYSDFALLPPALLPACGPPGQGGGPPTPVMAGTMCPATQRGPCGSSTEDAYLDGKGAKKKGYCVCDPNASKWSCATVDDWPPACLTDRP